MKTVPRLLPLCSACRQIDSKPLALRWRFAGDTCSFSLLAFLIESVNNAITNFNAPILFGELPDRWSNNRVSLHLVMIAFTRAVGGAWFYNLVVDTVQSR